MTRSVLLICGFALLTACGGGGGGGSSSGSSTSQSQAKEFSVSLNSIDVSRASNGDSISVDTSSIESAGLSYTPSN